MSRHLSLVLLVGCGFLDRDPPGQIFDAADLGVGFEEVTEASGLSGIGQSYGSGWGDLDGDGDLDLWNGNHAGPKSIFLNNGDGTFTDASAAWLPARQEYDGHGIAIVDLDNDGVAEIVEVVGANSGTGAGANRIYRLEDDVLVEQGTVLGFDYNLGSGRCVIPYDWNEDGRLDLLAVNQPRGDGQAPSALFTQRENGTFGLQSAIPPETEHPTALCGQLADLDGDHVMEVVRFGRPLHMSAHDGRSATLRDVSAEVKLPPANRPFDVVIADLTGDLRNDVFVTRWEETSDWVADADGQGVRMALRLFGTSEGMTFRTDGDVTITLDPPWFWPASEVYAGAECTSLVNLTPTLSAEDEVVQGNCPIVAGESRGLFIGVEDDTWTLRVATDLYDRGGLTVRSTAPITDLDVDASTPTAEDEANFNRDRLWIFKGDAFVDEGWKRGFTTPTTCTSAVAGDFDNDMDLDLFLACATPVNNTPDLFYLNDGQGRFQLLTGHGAEGTDRGRGDVVVVGDYDDDTFLDLYVTNGYAAPPFNLGPHQLFHNKGNDNRGLLVELVGTRSNRDGIGSTVILTAGDTEQVREANAGTHASGQNDRRLHFGLGEHDQADRIEVIWPDGTRQVLEDVPAGQVLRVVQE